MGVMVIPLAGNESIFQNPENNSSLERWESAAVILNQLPQPAPGRLGLAGTDKGPDAIQLGLGFPNAL